MIQSVLASSVTPNPRKKIRLTRAAQLFRIQATYLSRVARDGTLARAGVSVIRYDAYPDIVEFYEDEVFTWWKSRHPEWDTPQEAK